MTFDFSAAKRIIASHKGELGSPDNDKYINEFDEAVALFTRLNSISGEDRRQAAQIAVDMSKTLVQIALAALAVFFAFAQASGYPPFVSLRGALMVATFGCCLVSIIFGAIVVSGIWQRGEGRKPSNGDMLWSTEPAKRWIDWQARLGLLAVISFTVLILTRPEPQITRGFEFSLPGGDRYITSGEIVISGQWQNLSIISKKTQDKSQLPPTKVGQSDSITISPK